MSDEISKHLLSTKVLIETAFPAGLTDVEYLPVLKVLYPHMSDRNLSEVIAACSKYHQTEISNDIAKVALMSESEFPKLPYVVDHLKRAGLDDWLDED